MWAGGVKNRNVDLLTKKVFVSPWEMISQAATTTGILGDVTLRLGWSVGSSTYVQVPGARTSAIQFRGSTHTADYRWRGPKDLDHHWPVYLRPHWAVDTIGTTLSMTWTAWYSTITSASTLVTSPTTVLDKTIGVDSNNSSTVQYVPNIAGPGMIAPLATGINAYQTMADNVEHIHFALQPTTTTNITLGSTKLYLLGFDLEYTPRVAWGGPSGREGRKLETNLGWQEVGPESDYGI